MNIISFLPAGCQLSDLKTSSSDSYSTMLKRGQLGEETIAAALTASGLPSYRPDQRFICVYELQDIRQQGFCKLTTDYRKQKVSKGFKPELLKRHQRDVMVKIGKVKRLSVEVKVLTPAAFKAPMTHIGCTTKWDEKRFNVDILILVNVGTGEAFAVSPYEGRTRVEKLNPYDDGYDYAIPKHLLSPLEAWIDAIKDIHQLWGTA